MNRPCALHSCQSAAAKRSSPSTAHSHSCRPSVLQQCVRPSFLCRSAKRIDQIVATSSSSTTEHDLSSVCGRISQALLSVVVAGSLQVLPATAILNSPNALIPRSADAALRRAIPAFNPKMKEIQSDIEEVQYLLRIPQRKPWGTMSGDVQQALDSFADREELLLGVPSNQRDTGNQILDNLYDALKKLQLAVNSQQPEAVSYKVAATLGEIAKLELLEAPGLPYSLPKEYAGLPRLIGRAVVEFTVEAAGGQLAFVDEQNGGLAKQGVIEITLDGYSAPVSAGNFLVNVMDGLYSNVPIQVSNTSLLVPSKSPAVKPEIPLEILPSGEFDPIYRSPLDVMNGELPVLPLSIPGAVAMTHTGESESYVSGDTWFVFKFDKQQAGLAGLAFDEGTFGVFGYVTKGMDVVRQLRNGDVITGANIVSGAEKLVRPAGATSA